jgi:hypothetical protein
MLILAAMLWLYYSVTHSQIPIFLIILDLLIVILNAINDIFPYVVIVATTIIPASYLDLPWELAGIFFAISVVVGSTVEDHLVWAMRDNVVTPMRIWCKQQCLGADEFGRSLGDLLPILRAPNSAPIEMRRRHVAAREHRV